jgi:hypothetical protein
MRIQTLLGSLAFAACAAGSAAPAFAQAEPATRQAVIEQEQAQKVPTLHPYVPGQAEALMNRAETLLVKGLKWHPFFNNAYSGGGFALGAGYAKALSAYNVLDVRGSYSLSGYKRIEAEFRAPRLFQRRGALTVLGGWREATQVGFYGLGPNSAKDNRTNYLFHQPYAAATLTVFPTRRAFMLRGGLEFSKWTQLSGQGTFPSVETRHTPVTLPGLFADPTYVHSQGTFGFDWRTSPGYSRRGGSYTITFHDYNDPDKAFGFQLVDYEAIQHFPILREAWVISLRGLASTAIDKGGQQIPFFMLPSLGGGSNLRGYDSWRYRDKNSVLLQAEWRIMVNRFFDMAFFYDTGKVVPRRADLSLDDLKHDYGFGVRFHGPLSTPLRIEVAKGEKLSLIFASTAVF